MALDVNWLSGSIQVLSLASFSVTESHDRIFPYAFAGACILVLSLAVFIKVKNPTVDVPLEGSSGIISPYLDAYGFIKNAKTILKDAYKKYGGETFKVPGLARNTVIINKRDLIEEIRKAPNDKVSFSEAAAELFAARWTFGEDMMTNTYHIPVIRDQLTRALATRFEDLRDEIEQAFHNLIPDKDDEWVAISALATMRNVVCRASNRVFVGLPLCRDEKFVDLNITYTVDIVQTSNTISKVPVFLRPLVGPFISSTEEGIRRGMKILRPVLEERFRMYEIHGDDWPGKPVDLITWIIDTAPANEKRSVRKLAQRVLLVNFAAVHTSSQSFTHALFHLAAESDYIQPIREEVESVIKEEGWTKVAMTRMWKLDSFLKESQRVNGIGVMSLNRIVMSDMVLSDGTFLPADTFIAANMAGLHSDDAYYPNAEKFDGFRFSKLREENKGESAKHQMVNTSADYLSFGHGRHACPGRFFAVNELKVMMAYLILNYDLRTEVEGVRPENVYIGARVSPHPTAKVLLKKWERKRE